MGLVGLGSWMIWMGLSGSEQAPPSAKLSVLPGLAPVQGGAGVFSTAVPEQTESAHKARCTDCDVVLVTVCSLRKDHVGAYGALQIDTPHMDRVAAEGMRFESAYAASNFTLASLTAVLTGRFGSTTGVTGWDKGLTADVPTPP